MSASVKVVEAFGSPRFSTSRHDWVKSNSDAWWKLFKELEQERSLDDRYFGDNMVYHWIPDCAAIGIAVLITAEVIDRSEGEAFLAYWRDSGEQVLLPINEFILRTGLLPKTDPRNAEEAIAHGVLSELEAWRLL